MRLLLISSSKAPGHPYLSYPKRFISEFLGAGVKRIAFVPFAGVCQSYGDLSGYDAYEKKVADAFAELGYQVRSVHRDAEAVLAESDAILVGGGNTFNLLLEVQTRGLVPLIRKRVREDGVAYMGWSAGANLACPTIRTTNDMPIVEPPSFEALGFVPFQINPHYLDANPEGHFGESRETRINEFLEVNRDVYVAGLREGMLFRVADGAIEHLGVLEHGCRVFRYGQEPRELGPDDDLSFLLKG